MSARVFQQAAGRRYVISCTKCGTVRTLAGQDFGMAVASEQIPRKLRREGWEIGHKPEADFCPACALEHQRRKAQDKIKIVSTEPEMTVAKVVAEQPREMTRDERRLIFSKLNEVYLDERRGYDDGWSDKRVAEDLGIARAWVAKVRDENFGPLNTSPEAAALVAEARSLLQQAEAIALRVKEITKRIDAIEKCF